MAAKAQWTVLTFIAAHNNLEQFGKKSLLEILGVGSTSDVVLGAYFDGKQGAGMYTMAFDAPGKVEEQKMLGSQDSGHPSSVVAAARWLFEKYPAERYALVLWSHGTGWEPAEVEVISREARPTSAIDDSEKRERSVRSGRQVLFRNTLRTLMKPEKATQRAILFDDASGHSLDTVELGGVIREIAAIIKQPLDVLGMDACLMANVEVAYQLREHARYLVASQELVPGNSWPYQKVMGRLSANPKLDAEQFARLMVEEFLRHYIDNPPPAGDVTKVALDLSKAAALANAINDLAGLLLEDVAAIAPLIAQSQIEVRNVETRKGKRQPSKFEFHLFDVGSLARRIASGASPKLQAAANTVITSLAPGAGAVLAEGHVGEWFDGIGGVTIYLPQPPEVASSHYAALDFASATRWPTLMEQYRKRFPPRGA